MIKDPILSEIKSRNTTSELISEINGPNLKAFKKRKDRTWKLKASLLEGTSTIKPVFLYDGSRLTG
jgi:hypothetical protein